MFFLSLVPEINFSFETIKVELCEHITKKSEKKLEVQKKAMDLFPSPLKAQAFHVWASAEAFTDVETHVSFLKSSVLTIFRFGLLCFATLETNDDVDHWLHEH